MEACENEKIVLTSEGENHVNEAAEAAYAKITQMGAEISGLEMNEFPAQKLNYEEEGGTDCDYNTIDPTSILEQASVTQTSFVIKWRSNTKTLKEI
jgi:hypothetical protein